MAILTQRTMIALAAIGAAVIGGTVWFNSVNPKVPETTSEATVTVVSAEPVDEQPKQETAVVEQPTTI